MIQLLKKFLHAYKSIIVKIFLSGMFMSLGISYIVKKLTGQLKLLQKPQNSTWRKFQDSGEYEVMF